MTNPTAIPIYTGIGRHFTEWALNTETLTLTKLATLRLFWVGMPLAQRDSNDRIRT